METKPKKLFLVDWKQYKLELSKKHVNDISYEIMDEIVFNTIIDFCRKEFGFPAALPLESIISNEPVVPKASKPVEISYEQQNDRRLQTCPVCQQTIDARLYTSHLEVCFKKCNHDEVAIKIAKRDYE
jgi:hypothetical protein